MLKTNIPLNKLKNNHFKNFLEKHCKRHIPDESTLSKNYISPVYHDTIQQIKAIIGSNGLLLMKLQIVVGGISRVKPQNLVSNIFYEIDIFMVFASKQLLPSISKKSNYISKTLN